MSQLFNTKPPLKLQEAGLDEVPQRPLSHLVNVLDAPKRNKEAVVTVFGPEGAGKSFILAAMHNYWRNLGRLVYWTDCNLWPRDYKEAEQAITRALMARVWIADDLGREHETSRVSLARAIMAFLNKGDRVFLCSTNLEVNKKNVEECELAGFYGRAERSRLLSKLCFFVNGRDFRLESQ